MTRTPIRWWPLMVVLLLAAAAQVWIWLRPDASRQDNVLATMGVLSAAVFLVLVWVGAFSGLPWRARCLVIGGVLASLALTAAGFRVRGVTGDLRPILEWRWKKTAADAAEPLVEKPRQKSTATEKLAAEYPQFLGPDRKAIVDDVALRRDWSVNPPQELWRRKVGAAWSGFAVAGRVAVTQEQSAEEEMVVGYDLVSGDRLWTHSDRARYHTVIAGEGPRATPTISSNRVFTVGATGLLNCLDLSTGQKIWSKDIIADNSSRVREWGFSGSPLVEGKFVIVNPGGPNGRSVVAYDFATGEFIWGGGNDSGSYSSPVRVTIAGTPQILMFGAHQVASHDLASGRPLWEHPWPGSHPNVTVPLLLPGDHVLVSSGYGRGSALLKIESNWTARQVWKTLRLKSKFSNLIYFDSHIYGLDDGRMACLDAADGSLKWKDGRYGHGQMILAGKLLLVMAETGDLILLEPNPAERRELARLNVFASKTWNPPAIAGQHLVLRNDKEAACYQLPLQN